MTQKMHADEVDIDAALVEALLAEQFPQWAGLPVELVEPLGTDNAVYRIGARAAARLPRVERAVPSLRKECEWLPRLAPLLPLAVPVPLAHGSSGRGYPFDWAVYTWIDGEMATPERIADPQRAATDLAEFITALQRIDATGAPWAATAYGRGVPLARRDAGARTSIASLGGSIDAAAATAAWERALRAPEWDGPPVWLHGDLDSRNVLAADGRLSGVIDFGCLTAGDPACDVMVAWKLFSGDSRDVFRAALGVDDATWLRASGWALSQALAALAYYTPETNAVLVAESQHWLAEVLAWS